MKESDVNLAAGGVRIAGATALSMVNPLLVIPWELGFSLYGAVAERRKNKAEEWLALFAENKSAFSDEIARNPNFQDGFINAFETYLRERNSDKRKIMSRIFLGFAESGDMEDFPLERYYFVLGSISPPALRKLAEIAEMPEADGTEFFQVNEPDRDDVQGLCVTVDQEAIHELVSLNILLTDPASRFGPLYEPFVMLGYFGRTFIEFLSEGS